MTPPVHPLTRGEELMAELEQLRAWRRAPKRKHARRLQQHRQDAVSTRAEAEAILASLPRDPEPILAARRAVLHGLDDDPGTASCVVADAIVRCPRWTIRTLAAEILSALPPDPDAEKHRRALQLAARRRP